MNKKAALQKRNPPEHLLLKEKGDESYDLRLNMKITQPPPRTMRAGAAVRSALGLARV
jgi:hypothetical protein